MTREPYELTTCAGNMAARTPCRWGEGTDFVARALAPKPLGTDPANTKARAIARALVSLDRRVLRL